MESLVESHTLGPDHLSGPRIPELLAPAGDWECARAAVENGADAIYFGLERFNARMRAKNFSTADLPALMEFLHKRGVRGYVTFNTLVFQSELPEAATHLREIIRAGVDAAIVQDVGVCRLIRSISPDFPIHASTQMTVTSLAGVEFARKLGCGLVVLARECSIRDIERIQAASGAAAAAPMPLEVFVHGALCVAYSGQCLTSESLGGRSANRGECAQACRMPYELFADGQRVDLGDRRYLLSPQDLSGLEVLPDLARAGVASLKIEGRLKSPEYVASVTRVYREAIDRLGQPGTPQASERYDLEMAFSRGLHTGWFRGVNNQALVHARFGKKRGAWLGSVERVLPAGIVVGGGGPVKPGDGVVIDQGRPDEPEQGGRIYRVDPMGKAVLLGFGRGSVDLDRVRVGDQVWKTDDPELNQRVRRTFEGESIRHRRPIHFEVHGEAGQPMAVAARDAAGHVAQASSNLPLEPAQSQPLTKAKLAEQLGRLGGTPYRLGRLEVQLAPGLMVPVSELNRIRRELVAGLDRQRALPLRWAMNSPAPHLGSKPRPKSSPAKEVELIPLVRTLDQLGAALKAGVATVYCELEDPKRYREAVAMAACSAGCSDPKPSLFIAPPRIARAGEEWILKQVRSANADGHLVRNYDDLEFFKERRMVGDFSLNIANSPAAELFLELPNMERVTASYDLSAEQLAALLGAVEPGRMEVTLHQHMPMFHMEHCVFCAFLSTGTDYRNCGRPCDTKQVSLRDRVGALHPLKADAGCRNTVFNARAQTGAEYFDLFREAGARHFRIEFVNETPDEVLRTLACYRKLARGEMGGAELWRELKLINQIGVTRGQLSGAATGVQPGWMSAKRGR